MDPLKNAARDAPHLPAIYSLEKTLTFAELDAYVDRIELPAHPVIPVGARPTLECIAFMLAAMRAKKALFPINCKVPSIPEITEAPEGSLLLMTSGSTAEPKIAILSLENLVANAKHSVDVQPCDRWLLSLPLYHVGGIGILFRCLLHRACICLSDHPDITHLSYVPTQLYRATPVYKHLRCLLLGGAPLPHLPSGLPIHTTYGMTEMGSMITLDGRILPGREVQLSDEGEICVRGSTLFQGYVGCAPQTGWFATKDLGRFENGKLRILGRKDWMFISGGENIQPEEIERHVLAIAGIREAVVVAKDDPEFGKRPALCIAAENRWTCAEIRSLLQDKLPKYKLPVELHLMQELPKQSNFKINRFILLQLINNK